MAFGLLAAHEACFGSPQEAPRHPLPPPSSAAFLSPFHVVLASVGDRKAPLPSPATSAAAQKPEIISGDVTPSLPIAFAFAPWKGKSARVLWHL